MESYFKYNSKSNLLNIERINLKKFLIKLSTFHFQLSTPNRFFPNNEEKSQKGKSMSTEKLQLYKCEICGNLVQVILNGAGELVCCNQPMTLQIPQHDKSELGEKHAPKTEFRDDKKFVQVISHPMIPEHYIQFIEVLDKDNKEVIVNNQHYKILILRKKCNE